MCSAVKVQNYPASSRLAEMVILFMLISRFCLLSQNWLIGSFLAFESLMNSGSPNSFLYLSEEAIGSFEMVE